MRDSTVRLPALLFEVRRTLRPGDPGTQKLVDRFGDQLVCVRYRYDAATNLRMTTVELAVDTGLVAPRRPRAPRRAAPSDSEPVHVRVAYDEIDLRRRVKEAGGRWIPERKLWEISVGAAGRLGISGRIVRRDGES
jgi:hypothetical protein